MEGEEVITSWLEVVNGSGTQCLTQVVRQAEMVLERLVEKVAKG